MVLIARTGGEAGARNLGDAVNVDDPAVARERLGGCDNDVAAGRDPRPHKCTHVVQGTEIVRTVDVVGAGPLEGKHALVKIGKRRSVRLEKFEMPAIGIRSAVARVFHQHAAHFSRISARVRRARHGRFLDAAPELEVSIASSRHGVNDHGVIANRGTGRSDFASQSGLDVEERIALARGWIGHTRRPLGNDGEALGRSE